MVREIETPGVKGAYRATRGIRMGVSACPGMDLWRAANFRGKTFCPGICTTQLSPHPGHCEWTLCKCARGTGEVDRIAWSIIIPELQVFPSAFFPPLQNGHCKHLPGLVSIRATPFGAFRCWRDAWDAGLGRVIETRS